MSETGADTVVSAAPHGSLIPPHVTPPLRVGFRPERGTRGSGRRTRPWRVSETKGGDKDTTPRVLPPVLIPHSTPSSVTRITREERERNRTAGEGEVNRTEPSEEKETRVTHIPTHHLPHLTGLFPVRTHVVHSRSLRGPLSPFTSLATRSPLTSFATAARRKERETGRSLSPPCSVVPRLVHHSLISSPRSGGAAERNP